MTISEKNELLDRLSVCYNRTNYLKILCEEKNKPDEAAKLEKLKERLKLKIDGLLRDLYQNWIGSANELKIDLDKSNIELDKCIKEIEGDIETAQNIIKGIGYIDDVIKQAANLIP